MKWEKWEYCAIFDPVNGKQKKLKFFSETKNHKVSEIDDVHQSIAQLGIKGWELIFMNQISNPDARVYYFKKEKQKIIPI
ncbi:MAG: hypothetical protein ACXAC7_14935 [Candidatus Hodarchaeales archaeon]|jgi:hypothetical protein